MTLTLPATADCAAPGAVCTADGRRLESPLSVTVNGPPALSVADARAREDTEAAIDFAVTLSQAASQEITVRYATHDGTAKKGEDYRTAEGTLAFAAGETAKTVSVALLDDAKDEGEETFRLVLTSAQGAAIADGEATGTIEDDDHLQPAWLARFGRTVAAQAVDMVAARLEGGGNHVTVAGHTVSLAAAEAAAPGDGWSRERWMRGEDPKPSSHAMTGRELLLGSAFHVSSGGEAEGPAFTAWGRVATGRFDAVSGDLTLDGTVTTGFLGADVAGGRWLAGAAVAVSKGGGAFTLATDRDSTRERGTVESTLISVLPYARVALGERVTAWGLAGLAWGLTGLGAGAFTVSEQGAAPIEADLAMQLGAIGGRGTLVPAPEGGGFALAVETDALWVRTESDAVRSAAGNLAASATDAARLRLTFDASRSFALGGGTLMPSVEVGARYDGGDADTGAGVELGGRLGWTRPGVTLEARGRWLAVHQALRVQGVGRERIGTHRSGRLRPRAVADAQPHGRPDRERDRGPSGRRRTRGGSRRWARSSRPGAGWTPRSATDSPVLSGSERRRPTPGSASRTAARARGAQGCAGRWRPTRAWVWKRRAGKRPTPPPPSTARRCGAPCAGERRRPGAGHRVMGKVGASWVRLESIVGSAACVIVPPLRTGALAGMLTAEYGGVAWL